jgi:hypothetical protein
MYIIFVSFIFIIWFLNLELNPSLGAIWYRPNENGDYVFTLKNIIHLLKYPFQSTFLWNLKLWDVNFYLFLFFTSIYYILYKELYKTIRSI